MNSVRFGLSAVTRSSMQLFGRAFISSSSCAAQKLDKFDSDAPQSKDFPSSRKSAMSFNQIQLIGGCMDKPKLRISNKGTEFATFYVITNHNRKMRDGSWFEESMKHTVQAYGNLSKIAMSYIEKAIQLDAMLEAHIGIPCLNMSFDSPVNLRIIWENTDGTRVYIMGRLRPYRLQLEDGGIITLSTVAVDKMQIISHKSTLSNRDLEHDIDDDFGEDEQVNVDADLDAAVDKKSAKDYMENIDKASKKSSA
ncbi:unnamed protein product [Dracunculus medinensis]|uniref:DUF2470 domain-containing protein n=1 Tax=Dracunculus medinensis TaxID=318479 RepID=A0A0N4U7K8_DRAME|nr:unnamed protein product [Dracunculus medinensis]